MKKNFIVHMYPNQDSSVSASLPIKVKTWLIRRAEKYGGMSGYLRHLVMEDYKKIKLEQKPKRGRPKKKK